MNVAHDVGHSHYAEYPQPASMIAYGHNGHSSPRSSRSGRSHSRKKPSLFEKLCFGNSGYAEKVDSHDNNLDHERHGTRAVHSEDLNPMHSVYHSDAPSHHAQNYSPMHGGSHTMDAHPPWSRVHPSMQTHYEPVAMPHQIGLLSTFQQFTQSAPSRQLSRPTSQLGSPVGSVSIPVATTPPPPLGVVPGGWPAIQEPAAVTLQATPHAPIEPVAASIEQRKQMFEQSLRQQFDLENRRIQEITIAQKEVVRQRALEQKANIDRQAAAAMGNLDRRGAEQVVGLQRAAYSQHSQLEMQAAQAQAVNQLHHLARNGVDVRMHAAPTVMQFSQLPPPPMTIPTQAVPIATAGLDTNHDGRPNVMVTGPDMNRDGIPDVLQADVRHSFAPTSPYWQAVAHAGGHHSHSHVPPLGYSAAAFPNAVEGHVTPRSPIVVEFPSHQAGSPINTSVFGSSVQVAEEEDAIDETGQCRRVFQISGMNGEPLAIVQMLK